MTKMTIVSVNTTELDVESTKPDPDEPLVALLKENARLSTAALARRLGVARSTIQSRLERLERSGVIRGYTVRLGPGAARRQVQAHAMIAVEPQQQALVERKL